MDRADASPLPRPGSGPMFDRIADRYDLLNRFISLGLDRRWRRKTVDALALASGARVLDLATGTGDLAFEVLRRIPGASVVGLDPSARMLELAGEKVAPDWQGRIEWCQWQAEQLPFADASFDGLTMGFGIRNVADRPAALREMARVVRPGGRIAILEANEPSGGLFGWPARFYMHHVVPWLGARLSGAAAEYQYLQTSISAFPAPAEFAQLMAVNGLEVLGLLRLDFGVCTVYLATPGGRP